MFNEFLLIVLLNTQNKRGTNIYAAAFIEGLGAFFLNLGKRKEKRDSKDTYFGNLKKERLDIKQKYFTIFFSLFVFS